MDDWDVVVVGAGPAGLMAGARAAQGGRRTLLVEKNRKPGAKILMSGGTRCNLTHATDAKGIVAAFGPPGRFLHSALSRLGPQDLVDLLESEGLATKIEPGGKVFPESDKAADVLAALVRRLERSRAVLALGEPVVEIHSHGPGFCLRTAVRTLQTAKLILATGGQSYPRCGTTGEGYAWAAALGHTIVPPRAALVPLTCDAPWVKALQGITLADVSVQVVPSGDGPPHAGRTKRTECLAERRGSLLFTHFGLSGPAVLDISRAVSATPRGHRPQLVCDFLPDLSEARLDALLCKAALESGRRRAASLLDAWLPHRLAETLLAESGFPSDRRAAELSRQDRVRLVRSIKHFPIRITGTLGFEKAEVTAGGVALDEVDSRTTESKRVPNLFFAGELLDLDDPIGGYNFQAAFSTGQLAGESV